MEGIPKYHRAPNFSIPPPDNGGYLHLGSIIKSIAHADGEPINVDYLVPIPESKIHHRRDNGFTDTRSNMIGNSCGIAARLVALEGLGSELSWTSQRSGKDVYNFEALDTFDFNPNQQYLEDSMNQQDVNNYIVRNKYPSVYMVTGLKIARRPSVRMSKSKKMEFTFEAGIHQPGGLPIELGPRLNASRELMIEQGFEESDDFILGIRVKKLVYKRHWFTRMTEGLVDKEYNHGATMFDADKGDSSREEVLDLDDEYDVDTDAQIEVQVEESNGEPVQELWVVS